jgi:hypothetical protein
MRQWVPRHSKARHASTVKSASFAKGLQHAEGIGKIPNCTY